MKLISDKVCKIALSLFICLSQFSLAVFAIESSSTDNNLALNKPVTFSGVEGDKVNGNWKYPQFVGESAVDGKADTRWSAAKLDEQWLLVDLQGEEAIGNITIHFHAESPDYEVLVAGEDQNFKQLATVTDGSQGDKVTRVFDAKGAKVRYIKYQQNKMWLHSTNKTKYGSSIYELSVSAFQAGTITDDTLRVGTFNLAANKKFDIAAQSALTKQYNLEIVGLQEVDRFTSRNNFDMLESFKAGGYQDSYYSKAIDLNPGEYGVGTVSLFPLSKQTTTSLAWDGKAEQRVYQRSVFTKSGHEVAFYNTHLSYETEELRFKQMEQLKTAIRNDPTEYKIVVGDFNADQSRDEFTRFLDDLDMCNGYYGKWYDTFNGVDSTMKVNSVDNILVSRNLRIDEVEMVSTKVSDHNLLAATLTFLDDAAVSYEWLRIELDKAKQIDKDLYTDASFKHLQSVIAEANDIYVNATATQDAVNAAAQKVVKAVDDLELSNLAYQAHVTYSDVEGGKKSDGSWTYPQFVGEKAVDADTTTRWSAGKTNSQYLIVDLGDIKQISEVLLRFHAETTDYELQVSSDGIDYKSVFHKTDGSNGDTVVQQVSFPMQAARYVKFVQNKMWNHPTNGKQYSASLSEIEVYKEFTISSIELEAMSDVLSKDATMQMHAIISPELAKHKEVVYTSDKPEIASVNQQGLITGKQVGIANVSVASKVDPTIKATKRIQVVDGDIKVLEFRFEQNPMPLVVRDKRFLTYKVYPENAVNPNVEVKWSSSNSDVADIDEQGLLQTKKAGTTTITVQSKEDANVKGSITINVTKPTYSASYDTMKDRWLNRIVGSDLDMKDSDVKQYVHKIDEEAKALWSSMNKNANRTTLWEKIPSDNASSDMTTQFTKLKKLTLGFGVQGSSLYQNKELLSDILSGIDFMIVNKKYNGVTGTSNWWDCQIGSTQPLVDTLMVLSDYTDYSNIESAIKSIEGYAKKPSIQWPSYTATGANRTDIGLSVLGSAIIAKNEERMNLVKTEVPDVMKMVTTGDGLYADGSVIQHTKHAYTGSYGNELIKGVGRIYSIIDGTEYAIQDDRIQNIYNTISTGYIPLMHKGQMLSMVNGRSISRAPGTNPFTTEFEAGSETISNILLITQFAPEAYKKEYVSAMKGWLEESDGSFDFLNHARDFDAFFGIKNIKDDTSIIPTTYNGMHVYGSMDRVIQANEHYSAGLSMYSSRIYNYESGDENKKGWHTGDGVLYIYNDDLKQYAEGYWPTVDPYRLPGTTVDTRTLSDSVAYNKTSPQSWVGGTTNGTNGVAGMYYNASNLGLGMDVQAQKSWFFLDGKIVALGANISGTTTASIETTIENRMLTGNNAISINGQAWDKELDRKSLEAGSYVHMRGTGTNNDIGYYFPSAEDVQLSKETRTGKYADINKLFVNDKTYENTFFKMGVNHGKKVDNDSYEYVILPGANEEETAAFSKNNSVKVIRNDGDVQAVEDEANGVFAMNTWPESEVSVHGIKVNNSASVYTVTNKAVMDIYVSDPKQKNVQLALTLEDGYAEVLAKDDSISVGADGVFTINTNKSAGATHHISVRLHEADKTELTSTIAVAENLSAATYTPTSWAVFSNALNDAKAVNANEKATQEEVNEALRVLTSAIAQLKEDTTLIKATLKSAIDKAVVAEASEEFKALAPNIKALIVMARTTAQSVYDNPDATNAQCLEARVDLENALQYLEVKADKTLLSQLIKTCEALDLRDYKEGVAAFEEALAKAKSVFANENAVQSSVDEAYKELEKARTGLVKNKEVDKSLLLDIIAKIKKNVGDGSKYQKNTAYETFQKALVVAEKIVVDTEATQAEIDTALSDLANAYQNIRLIPSEAQLQELNQFVNVANSMNRNLFTKTQLQEIDATVAKAKEMLANFDDKNFPSLQKEMLEKLSLINRVSSKEPVKPETPDNSETTPNTGDRSNIALWMFMVFISGCSIAVVQRKRKRNKA